MIDLARIDELAARLTQALPPGARTMGEEAQAQFRAALQKGLAAMDVVTREDYELQKAALARAEEKLKALEGRLAALEADGA
ncbi:MAG: accessory factor UbiK family protein [Pseudomonadota bacterium]